MGYYVVLATDRPDGIQVRHRARPAHRSYLRQHSGHAVRVMLAGPTHEEDGAQMNGTMLVVEGSSVADVERFVADDPYALAGLFEQVVIRPWNCGMGHFEAE
jgi:uncharacterized protein YciI